MVSRLALLLSTSLAAVAALAAPAAAQSAPGVCVVIDASRDTLEEGERVAVRSLVLQAFENERLAVDPSGTACAETYVVSNIKLGNTINVTISGPRGQRTGRASQLDDLPNVYSQMVKSLVTGAPMETGGGATNRTNVTRDQSAPRRVAADNLKYVSLGYGGVIAGRFAYGPAFAGGYRKELDRIGIDIATAFLLANDTEDENGLTWALLRLAGLWYQNPTADSTSYYGLGVSYGLTGASDGDEHVGGSGLQGHVMAGYELFRSSTIRGFGQIDVTLPFYKSESTSDRTRYTPSVVMSIGFGWGKSNTVRVVND